MKLLRSKFNVKIFFSDLSCTHGHTCVYRRYAPGLFEEYLRLPGRRFGIIKPLTIDESPACPEEPRRVFSSEIMVQPSHSGPFFHPCAGQIWGFLQNLKYRNILPLYTVFSFFSVALKGGQLWHDLTRFHWDH